MENFDVLLDPKIYLLKITGKIEIGDKVSTTQSELLIDHTTKWLPTDYPDIIQAMKRRFLTGASREKTHLFFKTLILEANILVQSMLAYVISVDSKNEKTTIETHTYEKYISKLFMMYNVLENALIGLSNLCCHADYKGDANFISNIEFVESNIQTMQEKIINILQTLKNVPNCKKYTKFHIFDQTNTDNDTKYLNASDESDESDKSSDSQK